MKKANIGIDFEMRVYCPYCDHEIDLLEQDYEGEWTYPIFTNRWDDLHGRILECPSCENQIQIDDVEY